MVKSSFDPSPLPNESYNTWQDVQVRTFSIRKSEELLTTLLDQQPLHTLELKCIVAEAAKQTCLLRDSKLARSLFIEKNRAASSWNNNLAHLITGVWLTESLHHLQRQQQQQQQQPLQKQSGSTMMHVFLLTSILEFMKHCFVIDTTKKLQALKKRKLDWEQSTEDILKWAEAHQIQSLVKAAKETKERWKAIHHPSIEPSMKTVGTLNVASHPLVQEPVSGPPFHGSATTNPKTLSDASNKKGINERMRKMKAAMERKSSMLAHASPNDRANHDPTSVSDLWGTPGLTVRDLESVLPIVTNRRSQEWSPPEDGQRM